MTTIDEITVTRTHRNFGSAWNAVPTMDSYFVRWEDATTNTGFQSGNMSFADMRITVQGIEDVEDGYLKVTYAENFRHFEVYDGFRKWTFSVWTGE